MELPAGIVGPICVGPIVGVNQWPMIGHFDEFGHFEWPNLTKIGANRCHWPADILMRNLAMKNLVNFVEENCPK